MLRVVFLRVLRFSPLLKNQHFQIPIQSGMHRRTCLNEFIRTPKCLVRGKQIIVKRSKYFPFSDCDHFIYSTFFLSMYGYCLEKFDVGHPWDLKGEPFLLFKLECFIQVRYAIYRWPKLKVDWFCVIRSKLKISCWMLRKR